MLIERLGLNLDDLDRLTAVDIADRVAVVDDGQVVELGTPDELLAVDSRFRRYLRQWEKGQMQVVQAPDPPL